MKGIIKEYNGMVGMYYPDEKNFITPSLSGWGNKIYEGVVLDDSEVSDDVKERYIRETYCWGDIVKIHMVGEYQIVESINDGQTSFHCYINYVDTNRSAKSLDLALISCVAAKAHCESSILYVGRMMELY